MGKCKRIRKKPNFFQSVEAKSEKCKRNSKVKENNGIQKSNIIAAAIPARRIIPRENLLVWGRCRGFGWWPGRIANRSELSGPIDPPDDPTRWIKWYGDEKFTETRVDQMAYFHHFTSYFKNNVYKRSSLYRDAVNAAIKEAARRAGRKVQDNDTALEWAHNGFFPEGYLKILPELPKEFSSAEKVTNEQTDKSKKVVVKHSCADAVDVSDFKSQLIESIQKAKEKVVNLVDVCLGCGELEVKCLHPLFVGSLCDLCQVDYRESIYLYDEEGYSMYCCVCGGGKEVIVCDDVNCGRCFCRTCIEVLVGANQFDKESANKMWRCYMCVDDVSHGVLTRRPDWSDSLQIFMNDDQHTAEAEIVPVPISIPTCKREPIRVLSLFDGIATGRLVLDQLKIKVDCYYASEIDHEAICITEVRHPGNIINIGDVCDVTDKLLQSIGPFNLVLGGSPCNDLSIVNPQRKGLWSDKGSGCLFFEFVRILRTCQLMAAVKQQPFFWMFENVVCMDKKSKATISHFLQKNPVCLDAKFVSPAHRPRCFWGNLPGMRRPMVASRNHKLTLQECMEPGRVATTSKIRTVTTRSNSVRHGDVERDHFASNSIVLQPRDQRDSLWITEIERVFGFPDHYTDVCNLSKSGRMRALGKAWCVPVIHHLLSPLQQYFAAV